MNIFIASPLFNPPQIELIKQIESAISAAGHSFYSARLHSGSDQLSPEDRKNLKAWDPVFDSNVKGLNAADMCVAVLEYRQPEGVELGIRTKKWDMHESDPDVPEWTWVHGVELPDAGTVWEMGYMSAQGKPVVGFHSEKRPEHLNLMLTHGCKGLLLGMDALQRFLTNRTADAPVLRTEDFSWSECHEWESDRRMVE